MGTLETSVKKYITSLLIATPVVVSIQQLDKDYKNTIGEPVPYQKLGYNSLEHLLRSIPDTVQVKGVGRTAEVIPVVSEKSAHVNQLVTNQRIVKKKKDHFPNRKRSKVFFPPEYNHGTDFFKKFQNVPASVSSRKMYYPIKRETSSSQSVSVYSATDQSHQLPSYPVDFTSDKVSPSQYSQNFTDDTVKQANILGEMRKYENAQKQISEEKLTLNSIPITSNAKWSNKQRNLTNDFDKTSAELENSVPIQIRNNLRSLIRQCPEGIWCAQVPEKYRYMFRQELNYQAFGFKSLIHLCVCLTSIFHYVRPSTEDYKLYDRSRPLPDCAEKTYTMASYSTNNNRGSSSSNTNCVNALPNIDWVDIKKFLPGNIFMPGEEIPRVFVPITIKENDNLDVVIGEIYDLSKFWVYLDDTHLDQLMDDMQDFYKEHAHEYSIPNHLIKEGIYCVQVIYGEYHRALIVDRMPELEDTIRVIFIDYGTMTKVSTKGLCFLHTDFSRLEAQAIRCRLANVFPLEEGAPWDREACKAFRRLVTDRDMTAKISHINWDEQYLEVYLADVTNESDIFYINDRLVEEGFAQQADKERRQSVLCPIYVPIVKFLHLFPTFLELEHGLAPSTSEMEVFHDCNLPINFCYPQYFYIDHSGEEGVIHAAEDFHERHCIKGKRRAPFSHFMDMEKCRSQELDFSIFGDLQWEIKEALKRNPVKRDIEGYNTDEDFVDADEDFASEQNESPDGLDTVLERLELDTKDVETVHVLKKDLMVTEDIIKDINMICKVEPPSDETNFDLSEQLHRSDSVVSDLELRNECRSNENEQTDCTVVKKEHNVSSDSESQGEISNHPLSMMTFGESCIKRNDSKVWEERSEQNDPSYDLQLPDAHLNSIEFKFLPEDHPLYLINRLKTETEIKIRDFLSDELYLDGSLQPETALELPSVDQNKKPASEETAVTCVNTNPFLTDITNSEDTSEQITSLNPNNPFLTYHQFKRTGTGSEASSGSSSSTTYESPFVTKTQHSWSSFSDMSADTVSQLGRSLCGNSSSSNSLRVFDDRHSCSTQTSDHRSVAVQASVSGGVVPYGYAGPAPPSGYPAWSMGYNPNPYYNVRFANFHVYEQQYSARPANPQLGPPGLVPPPGFYPPNRFPMSGYAPPVPFNYGGPQYAQQVPPNFYGAGQFVMRRDVAATAPHGLPRAAPVSGAVGPSGDAVNSGTSTSGSASASECVSEAKPAKDFYEVYNEHLRQKLRGDEHE